MLRTNLATQPFYNQRAIRVALAVAVVAVAALTSFNALRVLSLNARTGESGQRTQQAEAQAAQYRDRARTITQAINRAEVTATEGAAQEANGLIARRAFSWTDLFNRFETTLPDDVRIASVEPQIDREGRMLLMIAAVSRRVEDLHAFIDQLELTGGLRDVIPRQEDTLDDGTHRSVIQGYYVADTAAVKPTATSTNASPATPRVPDVASPEAAR